MSANEYARQRGKEVPSLPAAVQPAGEGRKMPPLSEYEQAQVTRNRALVHEHMPELLPMIKELHELGMIDGWRNVEDVTVYPIQSAVPGR